MTDAKHQKNSLTSTVVIGLAIIILGFLLIKSSPLSRQGSARNINSSSESPIGISNLKPADNNDHIRGSLEAPVKIIEYSDTECPFCKNFHFTMRQLVGEYDGKVAWIYRHFPVSSTHPKALKEAEATECAAELGGKEMFWIYINRLFEITPSNNQLDLEKLEGLAEEVGLSKEKFKTCLDSGKHSSKISSEIFESMKLGISGTPYTVVIAPNGRKFEIRGAQSREAVQSVIETALHEK